MPVLSVASFEQLEEAVRGAIDGHFVLTGRETGAWSIATSMAGRLMIQIGEEGAANFYEGVINKDALILYMPLARPETMTVNGHDLDDSSVAIIPPNGLAIARALTAVHVTMITMPVSMLQTTRRFDTKDIALLVGSNGVLSVDPIRLASLRRIIQRFMAVGDPLPEAAGRAAEEEFMAHILDTAASSATSHDPRRGRPWVPREQVLTKILDLIARAETEVLYVEDLCRAAGVSERTLRSVFNETFGLGPIRYLRHRRLHLVRAALRAANPGRDTVASVATEFGFWDFGRLAREYNALFGELPSQTLLSDRKSYYPIDSQTQLSKTPLH